MFKMFYLNKPLVGTVISSSTLSQFVTNGHDAK